MVKEILTTERSYMKCLSIIIESYQKPLEATIEQCASAKPRKNALGITQEDVKRIFYQIKVIHNFNTLLLKNLEARIEGMSWMPTTPVGDIFVDMVSTVYPPYLLCALT